MFDVQARIAEIVKAAEAAEWKPGGYDGRDGCELKIGPLWLTVDEREKAPEADKYLWVCGFVGEDDSNDQEGYAATIEEGKESALALVPVVLWDAIRKLLADPE